MQAPVFVQHGSHIVAPQLQMRHGIPKPSISEQRWHDLVLGLTDGSSMVESTVSAAGENAAASLLRVGVGWLSSSVAGARSSVPAE